MTETGELHAAPLERAEPGLLRCRACSRGYPLIDGVPIVLADLEAWLETERLSVLARELPPAAARLIRQGSETLRRDDRMLEAFSAPEGDVPLRVQDLLEGHGGQILDLGCGPGLHRESHVVGLDANFALARAFPGRAVVGDAADPPFLAHSFDLVLAINLLDTVPDPRLVLGQADALLRPGGTLALSCPYAWSPERTPPVAQFEPAQLLATLVGDAEPLGLELSYEILEHQDRSSWRLRQGPRSVMSYDCQWIVARKRSQR